MKIIVLGDVHGNWDYINELIEYKKPNIILQTGDFGYFPNLDGQYINIKKWKLCGINNGKTKIYFCDGNHSDHGALKLLENNNEICPNIFYMKRGSILTINNINILFMGGANSIDKNQRIYGIDWWPDEIIKEKDVYSVPENSKIDMVISHTCPNEFKIENHVKGHVIEKDPSRDALSYILEKFKPKCWYFSHWHLFRKGYYNNCKWTCLNREGFNGWFEWLNI